MYYLPGKTNISFSQPNALSKRPTFQRSAAIFPVEFPHHVLRRQHTWNPSSVELWGLSFSPSTLCGSAFHKFTRNKTKTLAKQKHWILNYISWLFIVFSIIFLHVFYLSEKNIPFPACYRFLPDRKNPPKKKSTKPRNPWPFQQALLLWSNPRFFSPIPSAEFFQYLHRKLTNMYQQSHNLI